jgi:hypothetical protein
MPDEHLTLLRTFLQHTERALHEEGVPEETVRRILNRLLLGTPEGNIRHEVLTDFPRTND